MLGVIVGAFAAAIYGREFRWEAYDDAREMKRHVLGAVLMGIGGVTALGCTMGQGLTGISTLSIGSFLARRYLHRRAGWPLLAYRVRSARRLTSLAGTTDGSHLAPCSTRKSQNASAAGPSALSERRTTNHCRRIGRPLTRRTARRRL